MLLAQRIGNPTLIATSATFLGAALETTDPPRARSLLETAIEHGTTVGFGSPRRRLSPISHEWAPTPRTRMGNIIPKRPRHRPRSRRHPHRPGVPRHLHAGARHHRPGRNRRDAPRSSGRVGASPVESDLGRPPTRDQQTTPRATRRGTLRRTHRPRRNPRVRRRSPSPSPNSTERSPTTTTTDLRPPRARTRARSADITADPNVHQIALTGSAERHIGVRPSRRTCLPRICAALFVAERAQSGQYVWSRAGKHPGSRRWGSSHEASLRSL